MREEPYEIDSERVFRRLAGLINAGNANYIGANYILTADISLSSAWTPIGTFEHPFAGRFDGNGKSITGLTVGGGDDYFGLFGVTQNAAPSGIWMFGTGVFQMQFSD